MLHLELWAPDIPITTASCLFDLIVYFDCIFDDYLGNKIVAIEVFTCIGV